MNKKLYEMITTREKIEKMRKALKADSEKPWADEDPFIRNHYEDTVVRVDALLKALDHAISNTIESPSIDEIMDQIVSLRFSE